MKYILSIICFHINWKAHVTCNFYCIFQKWKTYQRRTQLRTMETRYRLGNGAGWSRRYYGPLIGRDNLEWPKRSFVCCKPFWIWFVLQLCSSRWHDFNWYRASRGPSAIVLRTVPPIQFVEKWTFCLGRARFDDSVYVLQRVSSRSEGVDSLHDVGVGWVCCRSASQRYRRQRRCHDPLRSRSQNLGIS